jgi:hypothetical protein
MVRCVVTAIWLCATLRNSAATFSTRSIISFFSLSCSLQPTDSYKMMQNRCCYMMVDSVTAALQNEPHRIYCISASLHK